MRLTLDWGSMPLVSVRTRAEIEGYAARLAEWFGERIAGLLCFGSVARGTGEQDASDIDLIAVIDGLPPLGERLLLRLDFAWDFPSRVDGIWITPDELAGHVRAKAGYMLDALDEGVILFDREGLLERTRTALGEELARRGVVKTERWWSFPLRLGETIELG